MGLVDQLVDPASLEAVAVEAAASLASGSLKPKRKPKALMNKLIEDNSVGRSVMWKKVRSQDFRLVPLAFVVLELPFVGWGARTVFAASPVGFCWKYWFGNKHVRPLFVVSESCCAAAYCFRDELLPRSGSFSNWRILLTGVMGVFVVFVARVQCIYNVNVFSPGRTSDAIYLAFRRRC